MKTINNTTDSSTFKGLFSDIVNSQDVLSTVSVLNKIVGAATMAIGGTSTVIKLVDDITDGVDAFKRIGDISKTKTADGWKGRFAKEKDLFKYSWKQGQKLPLWLTSETYDIFGVNNEKLVGDVALLELETKIIVGKYAELAQKQDEA